MSRLIAWAFLAVPSGTGGLQKDTKDVTVEVFIDGTEVFAGVLRRDLRLPSTAGMVLSQYL